jgi:YD repeat-containing protein
MTQSGLIRSSAVAVAFVLIAALLAWPVPMQADTAQYFYDELGRLVAVVDGQGNVAVYNYDEVGNLISIQRLPAGGGGGPIGIFFFSPSSGVVGTTVQIQGFGFSPTPSANQVAFNGTAATVSSATANSLVVTVPTNATTGPITVTNANGTVTSTQSFTVLVPPIITGIDPSQVPQGLTTRSNVLGFNLTDATAVTFTQAGLAATILSGATSQSLPITLSVSGTVPAGSYPFSVTTPAGTAESGSVTVTVAPARATFDVARPVSVFMPVDTRVPATSAPSGPAEAVAPPTSVLMPEE